LELGGHRGFGDRIPQWGPGAEPLCGSGDSKSAVRPFRRRRSKPKWSLCKRNIVSPARRSSTGWAGQCVVSIMINSWCVFLAMKVTTTASVHYILSVRVITQVSLLTRYLSITHVRLQSTYCSSSPVVMGDATVWGVGGRQNGKCASGANECTPTFLNLGGGRKGQPASKLS